jgi:hypothetical protein
MKRIIISMLCSLPVLGIAQNILLYNDGALVKVQAGAVLFVQGGIQNTATGTIDNDGIIEVQGNFVNAGAWEPSQPNTLRFSGTGNSDVTSGSAVFQTVEDIKDTGGNINLLDPMTINTDLNFNSAGATKLVTGNFDLKLGSAATVTGPDADEYVATTGTGMMQKDVIANNTFIFPIGDVANYSPLSCTYTGTGYTNANLRAKANDLTHPSKPADATDFISRYWDIDQAGITGYSNTMTGTYIPADINGSASLIKGAVHNGTDWFYVDAAGGANTVTGTTTYTNSDFTGTNFFGKVNLKVWLQGAYTSNAMSTNLPTLGQPTFPLTSPYADAPATATSIPAGVTDWVKVELRDVSNPATILGKASAFVMSDGTIKGLDGTSFPLIKNGNPSSIVAVFHRNHLPIRTAAGLDVVNPILWDFTTSPSQAYHNPANLTNENMADLGGGAWGLWRGNVNSDLNLNVLDFGLEKNNSNPSQSSVYSLYDVNMDKNVNVLDFGIVKNATNPSKSAHL